MIAPAKAPWPTDGVFHWKKRYFDVGDSITWRNWCDQENRTSKVTRIKVNVMGRVSYFAGEDNFIMIEDVSRAERGKDTSNTSP